MKDSGDYVSRKAAIELLKMALDDDWELEYAADRLSEIPAADVRPRWIPVEERLPKRCKDDYEPREEAEE